MDILSLCFRVSLELITESWTTLLALTFGEEITMGEKLLYEVVSEGKNSYPFLILYYSELLGTNGLDIVALNYQ